MGICKNRYAVLLFFVFLAGLFFSIPVSAAEVWDGTVATEFAGGDGTTDTPYQISNGKELAFLAQQVNAGNSNYNNASYILTDDIVLNESLEGTPNEWTAIGV